VVAVSAQALTLLALISPVLVAHVLRRRMEVAEVGGAMASEAG